MFKEIPGGRIGAYVAHFPGSQAQLVVASVTEGNTEAQLWAAVPGDEAVLLWDKGNIVFYLSGDSLGDTNVSAFAELVADVVRPRAIEEGLHRFKVRALSGVLESHLPVVLPDTSLHPTVKLFFSFQQSLANDVPAPDRTDLAFLPIDAHLLEKSDLGNVAAVKAEVRWMWPTLEHFYQHGFGVAARLGDQLVCWCTAEYVSRGQCGIGIETVKDYQKLGIATATAARFVNESLRRGIVPHWDCDSNHLASIRVAEKVGFTLVETATFSVGAFPGITA